LKKIFKVGTTQHFTYTIPILLKGNKIEKHWVIRNVKYIYSNNEEAKENYKNWFFEEYKEITKNWQNWYLCSNDDVDPYDMNEKLINIMFTEITIIDDKVKMNCKELIEKMQAENFKEWWFDNGECNCMS